MSRIITFLGKACTGQTTLAVATAKWFAKNSQRVLLVTHNPSPYAEVLLETSLKPVPLHIAPLLDVVQLQTTVLLEQVWDEVKKWLALYIPDSVKVDVYSGEVVILPGFDSLLGFNALQQYYQSDDYDVIIYDGRGDLESLRLFGLPESADWYFRRFREVFESLDLSKIADSIGGPIASAFVAANMDSRKVHEAIGQIQSWITKSLAVVGDAKRLTAYLVTTDEVGATREARWLWGSAQQIDLRVSGVLLYQSHAVENKALLDEAFSPLEVNLIPRLQKLDWEPLLQALPDFNNIPHIPQPLTFDLQQRQVKVFLPGFTKQQVKLTILGTELTVEAGEQRRNIVLPKELRNQPVVGGKFEEPYLIISF
ncbi:anion-transporting ATPase [Dulcicalothrix desertica PCC 7102]|uniref:Anion-transporting ATPase n=1 Tax=Dulcicalothrix desertica PCC 7102 TaxID=232991 RepID=A0A3S1CRX0_9CYAN|nr:ArsA family ATPase [Dulcicalothrix desertica]RUT07310.1 anion-transporting ATPase [Dulcicalothrix desertica PCC 7102]TWH55493.1 arsenite efflux ATP-binding protein ArsA [Dulcicalothrix desertica PCC 7102]